MEELVDSIGELTGGRRITKLIKLIIKAASTARKQNRICRKFARWLEMIEGLLKPLLEVPNLMERQETCKLLKELEESLGKAYQHVIKYKDRSYPYRFIMGSNIAKKIDHTRNEIKDCIELIPLIMLFLDQTTICRVDTCIQDKEEEMDRKPPKGGSSNKKRVTPMMVSATVVLKVGGTGLRCECNGCVDKIRRTLKIKGVQKVDIESDKNQVTVTGTNMDIENLVEKLGKKVHRPVEVVHPGMTVAEARGRIST